MDSLGEELVIHWKQAYTGDQEGTVEQPRRRLVIHWKQAYTEDQEAPSSTGQSLILLRPFLAFHNYFIRFILHLTS